MRDTPIGLFTGAAMSCFKVNVRDDVMTHTCSRYQMWRRSAEECPALLGYWKHEVIWLHNVAHGLAELGKDEHYVV